MASTRGEQTAAATSGRDSRQAESASGNLHQPISPTQVAVSTEYPFHSRDRQIARRYLRDERTTYQIAEEFGLTRPRICQILHDQAVQIRRRVSRFRAQWTSDHSFAREPVPNGPTLTGDACFLCGVRSDIGCRHTHHDGAQ